MLMKKMLIAGAALLTLGTINLTQAVTTTTYSSSNQSIQARHRHRHVRRCRQRVVYKRVCRGPLQIRCRTVRYVRRVC